MPREPLLAWPAAPSGQAEANDAVPVHRREQAPTFCCFHTTAIIAPSLEQLVLLILIPSIAACMRLFRFLITLFVPRFVRLDMVVDP